MSYLFKIVEKSYFVCYNFYMNNLNIVSAVYKTSATSKNQFLSDLPEFAFVGKSNVGKSSLINSLTNSKKLARTSSTPGLTKMINYFLINNRFYFVDLPGYGYSKTGKSHQQNWSVFLEDYLSLSKNLKLVFLLIDIRHKPSELDLIMQKYLFYHNKSFKIIATKCDKIAKSKVKNYCQILANSLAVGLQDIIPFSVRNFNENLKSKETIFNAINNFLN